MTATEPRTSWDLVTAAQAGDADAFGELYERYRPRVRAYLRHKVGGDRELVEDLTSEAFTRALAALHTVGERSVDPAAWLIRIARNLLFDHFKRCHTRFSSPIWEVPEPRDAENPNPAEVLVAAADHAAVEATVNRCLARLTPIQRDAVTTFYLDAERDQDLANARRNIRGRAVRTMRRHLLEEGITSTAQCCDATTVTAQARRPRMTATIGRPSTAARPTHRGRNYVECPAPVRTTDPLTGCEIESVCGVPTGTLTHHGYGGFRTEMLPSASGYEDGARCKEHARSVVLRSQQSEAALAWVACEDVRSQLVHE